MSGTLNAVDIPLTNALVLGTINVSLSKFASATKLNCEVSIGRFSNDWDFWVYPSEIPRIEPKGVLIARTFDAGVKRALEEGRRVLFLPDTSQINSTVPPGFSSIFWNTAWTSKQPPHTLGVLCSPAHPALRLFPTEYHSNWQWWDLVSHSRAMVLDSLPSSLRPVVQLVDDWFTNRKLGLVFEAKVGKGAILVCSIDLNTQINERPVARQFLQSLERYIAGSEFAPKERVEFASLSRLFKPLAGNQ
jgi:hypothetical protein